MNPTFLAEMAGVFLDEVEEQLHTIDKEILKLEQNGASDGTIQSLFRAAHTLKGSSATMGFEEMKQLTHEMEHVLDLVRRHELAVTDTMINLLFKCLDHLSMLKDDFVGSNGITTNITTVVQELQQFVHSSSESTIDVADSTLMEQAEQFIIDDPEVQLKAQQALNLGDSVYHVHVKIDPNCMMISTRAWIIMNQLESYGETIHSSPAMDDLMNGNVSSLTLDFLLVSNVAQDQIQENLQSIIDVAEVQITTFIASSRGAIENLQESTEETSAAFATDELPPVADKKSSNDELKRKAQTIRVDVDRLEHLMNLVGELVIDQTRIHQVGNVLRHRYRPDENIEDLGQISDHISRIIGELQESVMKVRMLPIEQLFSRFPRMIRDLSQTLNKEVDLIIEGTETELDRTVIEEIGDPLIHLIRNAVDHGLESPEERVQRGKPAKGRLRIAAAHEENQVVLTVEDDGAGIDPTKIKASALRKEIITEEEAQNLSDQEAIYLIFQPGFSTAASISDVSGRGVGMDIVKNHIEKLHGIIDIETKLGEGTKFKIKLPLTLAIVTGLLVKLNERTFILPMSSVVEIVRITPNSIQTIKGDSVVTIRERVIPVAWLHDDFHIPRSTHKRKHIPIVVVGSAEKRIALVVDELLGNQEIVVKSLGSYVGKIDAISGATILGDGRVALILEVAGVMKLVNRL